MSTRTLNLTDPVYQYLLDHSLREPAPLRQLREEMALDPASNMQISPEQGQFMQLLVRLSGARRVLEVGVFTGYSSTAVALALPDGGQLVACDLSKEWTDIARRYWQKAGVEKKIQLQLAPAMATLQSLIDKGESGQFDFAFIDADKANYVTYYELCLELLRPGGLLLIDNVLWGGRVADNTDQTEDTRAIRELNDRVHKDLRVEISMLPVGDGLTLVMKNA